MIYKNAADEYCHMLPSMLLWGKVKSIATQNKGERRRRLKSGRGQTYLVNHPYRQFPAVQHLQARRYFLFLI